MSVGIEVLDLPHARIPPPPAMPQRKRRQAGALAQDADGDGAGPGPSSERAAVAPAGMLDVLEAAVLVEREAKRALRMASKAACAAVERMAMRMRLEPARSTTRRRCCGWPASCPTCTASPVQHARRALRASWRWPASWASLWPRAPTPQRACASWSWD
jgi:hypothetical protein